MAIQEVLVSKIFNYTSEPTKKVEGQFWFNPSTNVLSRYNGTVWKPITVSSDDVAVLSDGSKISLTNYLNTQIAALAEGIDSKQDKLTYYSETSGDSPSATISATNINLRGRVAEGSNTTASGYYSHAEGVLTTASGNYSHAEGSNTIASQSCSHAEGASTTASGNTSHAEGIATTASGDYSHAEGANTTASSDYQHVQGQFNIEDANDKYADIIGNGSENAKSNAATVSWDGISWSQTDVRAGGTDQDNATYSLAALSEGKQDKLAFYSENTENFQSNISAPYIKLNAAEYVTINGSLEGSSISTSIPTSNAVDTKIVSEKAVATALANKQDKLLYYSEVSGDTPSATISVANIKLTGKVAEGNDTTTASGEYSHAEGGGTTASGYNSHAEGCLTTASGDYSHAECNYTTASGISSHSEGYNTAASGSFSHAEGEGTTASSAHQHAQGKYNIEDANNKYADIIGNGTTEDARSNAATVSWDGISWSQTDVRAGGTDQDSATHSLSAKQNATDNNLTTIDKTIVGAINGLNTQIDNSSGMLYFTGSSYGTNGTFSAGEVFTVAYRTDFQFAVGSATTNQYRPWSVGNPAANNVSVMALGDDRLRISYNGGGFCAYMGSAIRPVIKPINDIVIIVTNPAGGNINTSLYVNGVQIPQASYTAQPSLEMTGYRVNARNYAASLIDTTMKDFAIFNFDMSAEDAPYSVADYSAGKPVPPSALAQTAVLLENYTFTVGSTQYIPDVSGNNNDATITGSGTVAGTFDKAIAKLASLITSTNA